MNEEEKMEIEVGEYVRTKRGTIHKIERRDMDKHLLIDTAYLGSRYFTHIEEKEDIVKHSKNIIDLIEVGDYVNGEKADKISEASLANDYKKLIYCNECEGLYKLILNNDEIKSIITKEQIASIEYKVEEDK